MFAVRSFMKIPIPERFMRQGDANIKFVALRHKFACEKSAHQYDFSHYFSFTDMIQHPHRSFCHR